MMLALVLFLVVQVPGSALAQDPELMCGAEDLAATVDKIAVLMNDAQAAIENGDLVLAVQLLDLTAREAMLADGACRDLQWSGEGEFNDVFVVEVGEGAYLLEYEFTGASGDFAFGANATLQWTSLDGNSTPGMLWEMSDPGETKSGRTALQFRNAGQYMVEIDVTGVTDWRFNVSKP